MPYLQPSITKQTTVESGTVGKDFYLPVDGSASISNLTVDGFITTEGALNSAGLIMKNAQHISILDGGSSTQNESLRIEAGTTGAPYPDGAFANLLTGLNGAIGFGVVGEANPSSFIAVGGLGNSADEFILDGQLSSKSVQTNQIFLVNTDPAKQIYGTATLTAGSVVINTTQCAGPSTIILLTRTDVNASTSLGELRVRQRNVGSFIIESDGFAAPGVPDTGDVSTFDWVIINPSTTP
jgi:hypothetical protein